MRPISGTLILTLGMMGSAAAYFWLGLFLFFAGQALGVVTDRGLTEGLFAVGALAGGIAGLFAGLTAVLGVRALAVHPPRALPVFLSTWGAWMLLGGLGSIFLRRALSPQAAASLLGVCHLVACALFLATQRWRIRRPIT
ncbi:hypothetical protein HJC10_09325 [Corallococcus exiguus]|uniref:hypothetical protein n=1 Tax=Corallococcus TaxID=83461 RepID=UPI000EEE0B6A|nr:MULTISPECIES: hypothetical protein [Corallococcus]NNB94425.1 hypothetical protein [Corallococcus exiguus]NNC03046.1 hypothetical protein [Corallococcus exiguus]NPC45781.1 hypothetical protein [Corallococcus exiguus]RKH85360.1 hypothetical protein D7X99_06520 [Corallococcus sp. AB032C]